ncbi:MAG: hypothetical protein KJ061_15865 [Vicinamibacteraceae bacterium]|nr:hypothetical protein [Vicinamibacteraceae bacterium]
MSPRLVRLVGLAVAAGGGALLLWLYAAQPATLAEVRGGLTSTVGLYRIDEQAFAEGLDHFRADRFVEARRAFERADPARRDATTQFYIAYAFYRQGWGRVYNDDVLFRAALEALDRADANASEGRVAVDDANLKLPSSDLLRAEVERGLTREWSDLNPLRVLKERQ